MVSVMVRIKQYEADSGLLADASTSNAGHGDVPSRRDLRIAAIYRSVRRESTDDRMVIAYTSSDRCARCARRKRSLPRARAHAPSVNAFPANPARVVNERLPTAIVPRCRTRRPDCLSLAQRWTIHSHHINVTAYLPTRTCCTFSSSSFLVLSVVFVQVRSNFCLLRNKIAILLNIILELLSL